MRQIGSSGDDTLDDIRGSHLTRGDEGSGDGFARARLDDRCHRPDQQRVFAHLGTIEVGDEYVRQIFQHVAIGWGFGRRE